MTGQQWLGVEHKYSFFNYLFNGPKLKYGNITYYFIMREVSACQLLDGPIVSSIADFNPKTCETVKVQSVASFLPIVNWTI